MSKRVRWTVALGLAALLLIVSPLLWVAEDAIAQGSKTVFNWVQTDALTVNNDATVGDDLAVTDAITAADVTSSDDIVVGDDLTVTGTSTLDDIAQTINSVENLGTLPTVISANVAYTDTTGLFTIGAGEIWIIHNVFAKITTNYDCTGDNCTFQVGDGNDANGLLDLVDAELQAADTEGTGFAAGWQGQLTGTMGAYLGAGTQGGFIYAPSSAETIDFDMGGTSPAGGAATIYIVYTRIQ